MAGIVVDHPHGRGENPRAVLARMEDCGPSPRAWGKLSVLIRFPPVRRTIPTGVGKTSSRRDSPADSADHPHGRGENWTKLSENLPENGPSPRAWGKRLNRRARQRHVRTIPTGVGKTLLWFFWQMLFADHPHGRGENASPIKNESFVHGPSPRAWGKLILKIRRKRENRTIPTGVGKTVVIADPERDLTDHPHGRGENRHWR